MSFSRSIFFYFNGTPLEFVPHKSENSTEKLEFLKQKAHEMLIHGVQDGTSLTEQGDDYLKKLVEMEKIIREAKETADKEGATESLPLSNEVTFMWVLNILALIELGRLADDDMNGVMIPN